MTKTENLQEIQKQNFTLEKFVDENSTEQEVDEDCRQMVEEKKKRKRKQKKGKVSMKGCGSFVRCRLSKRKNRGK